MRADFVDATVFLGMHSTDEQTRTACASFFAERLARTVVMSLEQVGRCDDVVWGYPRELQDLYYPFMDNLHTVGRFDRLACGARDLANAAAGGDGLDAADRLLLAMVENRGGVLYTLNPTLLSTPDAAVRRPCASATRRAAFPPSLEELYRTSLALRVDVSSL